MKSGHQRDRKSEDRFAEDDEAVLAQTMYNELRKFAAGRMAQEYSPQTLQATALVHEAWLRVGGENQPRWVNRAQFFSSAAEAMRRILVDRARSKKAARHGGRLYRVSTEVLNSELSENLENSNSEETIIALHESLERFSEHDPESAELVKLIYFGDLRVQEAAQVLGYTLRTTERKLAFARAWIGRDMARELD